MSKRGGFPGGMGGFGGMNINNLMKEAKKMQAEMQKSQEELASKEFDATAGGGAISVKVTGEKIIKEIKDIDAKVDNSTDYYNDNITTYNTLIKKFPSNIVAMLCKYKEKLFFDRKDMSDEDYDDFKL